MSKIEVKVPYNRPGRNWLYYCDWCENNVGWFEFDIQKNTEYAVFNFVDGRDAIAFKLRFGL